MAGWPVHWLDRWNIWRLPTLTTQAWACWSGTDESWPRAFEDDWLRRTKKPGRLSVVTSVSTSPVNCSINYCGALGWVLLLLVQFSSVAQSCLTLCDPMGCSTPGLPVFHHLPELAQTHVHWDGDAIQPSCPLSSPSPPAFNLSQHQGLLPSWKLGNSA